MDKEEPLRNYVGKGGGQYSGMVLDSIFDFLRRAVVAMVIVGIFLMLLPIMR